jgi:hypothetical protein
MPMFEMWRNMFARLRAIENWETEEWLLEMCNEQQLDKSQPRAT